MHNRLSDTELEYLIEDIDMHTDLCNGKILYKSAAPIMSGLMELEERRQAEKEQMPVLEVTVNEVNKRLTSYKYKWLEELNSGIYKLYLSPVLVQQQTHALTDVIAERQRQITAEGYTTDHDDKHSETELSDAAAAYALHAYDPRMRPPDIWPWDKSWWKQTNPRRDLVKAAALILAEIERLDRVQEASNDK
ncbi:hypothetical protein [Limnobaculum xujianqingii]|uniref:hypothetical protein n=1 Tax=Limnobaculum xujianqingii TaxID=2738837 RepID=UPI00112D7014|nr:hypothetical protein [Limnobaculum xujianqingii]